MKILKYVLGVVLIVAIIAAFLLFEGDFPAAEVDAKYSNAASQFLSLADGAKVHYRDQGNPQGPNLVLIHGSNASLHTWEPWVGLLGNQFRIVTLDLPGHGLTGQVPNDDYSSENFVRVVKSVTQHLGLSKFALGGNSMGGGVTWRYTLTHPDDVTAMILVDASGLPAWREELRGASQERSGDGPLVFRLLGEPWFQSIAGQLDTYYLVRQGLYSSHFDPAIVDDNLINRYYDLSMREGSRAATLVRFSSRQSNQQHPHVDLSNISQPSLILWGDHDNLIPASVGEKFAAELSNAELIVYQNIGHVPMEEIPEKSAADVRKFLSKL